MTITKSDAIRDLARMGMATAEIARHLGVRYQHAYNVLHRDGALFPCARKETKAPLLSKSQLSVDELLAGGFVYTGRWCVSADGVLGVDRPLPQDVGVYAFALDGVVRYVGVATMGLAKRLYFYGHPGKSQKTSIRVGETIRREIARAGCVDVYVAMPPDLEWNGLPVHGAAGLELGLIRRYALPWNIRSAG